VRTRIEGQLGLTLTDCAIKVKEITVWGKAGGTTPIGLQPFAPVATTDEEPDPMTTKSDAPGTNRRAVIRYRWPFPHNKQPVRILSGGAPSDGFLFGISGEVDLMHLTIVWRTQVFQPVPSRKVVSGEESTQLMSRKKTKSSENSDLVSTPQLTVNQPQQDEPQQDGPNPFEDEDS